MKLDSRKELTPVVYSNIPVKTVVFKAKPYELCFKEHWHERMEILFIKKGSMRLKIRDTQMTAIEGETAIVCPENIHMGSAGENGVEYVVLMFDATAYINSTSAVIGMLESLIRGQRTLFPKVNDQEIASIVKKIYDEAQKKTETASVYAEGCVYILLSLLFEKYSVSEYHPLPQKRFSRVFDYISENLDRDLSTEALCKTFGYDKSYFCRRFKADSGLSPSGYVRIMRLEKSKGLLTKGISVSDAAMLCGFSTYGYFERCFKKQYKMTPRDYVKKTAK